MTPEYLADEVYQAMMDASNYSERSLQAGEFKAGISDLGFCSERTRRMLDQQVPEDTDALTAFIGTAIGDHVEKAFKVRHPEAIIQSEVALTLEGDQRAYTLTGHPDVILPEECMVLDIKTTFGLGVVQRTGPSQQQQFQRHCYAKAAHETGLFDCSLDEVKVANVWIDRGGVDHYAYPHVENYDPSYVYGAAAWLDDVVYAYLQGEEARKEPPREMCAVACGFYRTCRAYDTDVEGLLTDEVHLTAVEMYREGLALEKEAKRLKEEAKQHLVGVRGSTGEYMVRWTHVNETLVPESKRSAYDKLEVRPIPRKKVQGK